MLLILYGLGGKDTVVKICSCGKVEVLELVVAFFWSLLWRAE